MHGTGTREGHEGPIIHRPGMEATAQIRRVGRLLSTILKEQLPSTMGGDGPIARARENSGPELGQLGQNI